MTADRATEGRYRVRGDAVIVEFDPAEFAAEVWERQGNHTDIAAEAFAAGVAAERERWEQWAEEARANGNPMEALEALNDVVITYQSEETP